MGRFCINDQFWASGSMMVRLATALAAVLSLTVAARGERTVLLESNRSAWEMRLQLAERAQLSLDIGYYIVEDDCTSHVFLESLIAAAHRGVRVRLIVDAISSDIDGTALRQMLAAGVQVKQYHSLRAVKPLTWSRRMHEKILIRDGFEMIVGSRNIEDAYFGISRERANYLDLDLYVMGPVVEHANQYYQCLWESDEVRCLTPANEFLLSRVRTRLCDLRDDESVSGQSSCGPCRRCTVDDVDTMRDCWQRIALLTCEALPDRPEHEPQQVQCVRFLHDPPSKNSRTGGTRESLYAILEGAQESIVLQSPYVIPDGQLGEILCRAARRGVCVFVLTNSLETTDNVLAYAAFSREAPDCIRAGARFWVLTGPEALHAKSFVVDGYVGCVTSFNFDSRSAFLNTELATVVCDEAFAGQLLDAMARNFADADTLELDGSRLTVRPQPSSVSAAHQRQWRVARTVEAVNRVPGMNRLSERSLRFLQGLSRLLQRQL